MADFRRSRHFHDDVHLGLSAADARRSACQLMLTIRVDHGYLRRDVIGQRFIKASRVATAALGLGVILLL
ncbi:MAG TPA: hypothetical protein VGB82_04900 [Alphaproteobacteria bacterium]